MFFNDLLSLLSKQMSGINPSIVMNRFIILSQIPSCPIGTCWIHGDTTPNMAMLKVVSTTSQKACQNIKIYTLWKTLLTYNWYLTYWIHGTIPDMMILGVLSAKILSRGILTFCEKKKKKLWKCMLPSQIPLSDTTPDTMMLDEFIPSWLVGTCLIMCFSSQNLLLTC